MTSQTLSHSPDTKTDRSATFQKGTNAHSALRNVSSFAKLQVAVVAFQADLSLRLCVIAFIRNYTGVAITTNVPRENPSLDHDSPPDRVGPVGTMPYKALNPDTMVWLCYFKLYWRYTFRAAPTKRHRVTCSCPKVERT
jgi:hypothetical protein